MHVSTKGRLAVTAMIDLDTNDLWSRVNARMIEVPGAVSLQALVDEERSGEVPARDAAAPRETGIQPLPRSGRTGVPNSVFALGLAIDGRTPPR